MWYGFGTEDWPVPESGTAVCRVCSTPYLTNTDGFPIGSDLAGKFWFIGTCENCTPERRQGELHDSLESIFDAIHDAEAWARIEDRIDRQIVLNTILEEKKKRRGK